MEFSKQFRLFPESASTTSGTVDAMMWVLLIASAFIDAARFRAGCLLRDPVSPPDRRRDPHRDDRRTTGWKPPGRGDVRPVHGHVRLRRDAPTFREKARNDALEINVVGKQWMWKIQHPGGQREIDELHVPVGRPVKLIMTSQDVIHSFGLPAFRITQDVLARFIFDAVVHGDEGRANITCSAASIAARDTRKWSAASS